MFNRDDGGFYSEPGGHSDNCRALAMNLKYDHRVSPEREETFRAICPQGRTDIDIAVSEYHEKYVRWERLPQFVDPILNFENRIPTERQSPETSYVNILDLTGLLRVIDWDQRSTAPLLDFSAYSLTFGSGGRSKDEQFRSWLDDKLDPVKNTTSKQQEFVGRVLRVIGNRCKTVGPYNPVWVAPFEAFEKCLGHPGETNRADRWQRALGLAKEPGRWLAVVRYTLAELGRELYRPTQLDAGNYGWHFPSHPRRPPKRGGQAMSLWIPFHEGEAGPISEYIHPQCDCLTDRHVLAVEKTALTNDNGIVAYRRQHRQRLRDINPFVDDDTWLPC